jgi:hypothetical protein
MFSALRLPTFETKGDTMNHNSVMIATSDCETCGCAEKWDNEAEELYCPTCENESSYLQPGTERKVYVNAYSVYRVFGGREEGGWYYNVGQFLSSIPIVGVAVRGCGKGCYQCGLADMGVFGRDGKPALHCRNSFHLVPKDATQAEMFVAHLKQMYAGVNEGDIYSVNGGSELHVCIEDHPGANFPQRRPTYE